MYASSNKQPLTCFYNGCTTVLNRSFIQAFVSVDIYRAYLESIADRQLFATGHYRQCPSKKCSNLLIVDEHAITSALMCSCGQRVCSVCYDEYHFPATCKQIKSYTALLKRDGVHSLINSKNVNNQDYYIAEGKNCPNCGEFVEKNGG